MRPSDTVKMHFKSKQYIEETVQQHKDKPVVVVTHMAPTFESVNEKYKGDTMGRLTARRRLAFIYQRADELEIDLA